MLCNAPKATKLQMAYCKFKSKGLTPGSGMASQKHSPQTLKGTKAPCWLAGWLAEVAVFSTALKLSPVLSHSGPWLVWGRRTVAAPAAVTAPHGSHASCPVVYKPTH